MDSLILTFNKQQLDLYKELSKKENIELDVDTSMPKIDEFNMPSLDSPLSAMENEAKALLKHNVRASSFSAPFSQEEIKALTPVYYNALLQIKRQLSLITSDTYKLSSKIGEINRALANINKRYADFLPYKAALYNKEGYYTEINLIDTRFKENIKVLDALKAELLAVLERCEKITNIVSDFMQASSKASDEPKFKSFDSRKFFLSVEAFIEQIKAIKSN